jgi:hypothetical protein
MWLLASSEDSSLQLRKHQQENACNLSMHVIESSEKYAVDPFILSAIIFNESRWTPSATNNEGAIGLGQIKFKYVPETKEDLLISIINIDVMARLLSDSYYPKEKYNYAIACYASGRPKCSNKKYAKWIIHLANRLKTIYSRIINVPYRNKLN